MTEFEYEQLKELKKIRTQQEWDSGNLPADLMGILFMFIGIPAIAWLVIKEVIGAWH